MLTKRQNLILDSIVRDYISSDQPISSDFLEKKHSFGLSPATLRIEMQKLTDGGYLVQPHTSAGRVPTDKGYRFFVDKLLKEKKPDIDILKWLQDDGFQDTAKFLHGLTRKLALKSHSLVLSYLKDEDIFWKEGWEGVLREPEFGDQDYLLDFANFLEDFEREIGDFKINSEVKIYIGRESPWKKSRGFSIISSMCRLPNKKKGILSLVGPKRMDYERNIGLINSLIDLW